MGDSLNQRAGVNQANRGYNPNVGGLQAYGGGAQARIGGGMAAGAQEQEDEDAFWYQQEGGEAE